MTRQGLGVYPDHACFDPDRPAWLPYWVDTVGENACKWGFYPGARNTPPGPVAPTPRAPQTPGQMTDPGAWTPDDSAPTWVDWVNVNRDNLRDYDPLDDGAISPVSAVLLAAAVVGIVMLWPAGGRRRRR
jgi:hypothetical protein